MLINKEMAITDQKLGKLAVIDQVLTSGLIAIEGIGQSCCHLWTGHCIFSFSVYL